MWHVQIDGQHYTLAILDEFRPATFEDFEIPNLIYEEDDQRINYVSATYFSDEPIKDTHQEKLAEFAHMLTEHLALAHCEVIIKIYQENPGKAIDRIMLTKYGFKESDMPLEKLLHFNQE